MPTDFTSEIPPKKCTKCGEWKLEAVEFFEWRKDTGKFRGHCKICENEYRRRKRAENPYKRREIERKYRANNSSETRERIHQWKCKNADKVRANSREYYANNKDKINQRVHQWNNDNREAVRKRNCQWNHNNQDKRRAATARRRARKLDNGGNHTAEDVQLQIRSQTNKKGKLICWWCSKPIKETYHVDHVIPLDKGGSNAAENLVISCPFCNISKRNKLPHEWIGRLF